MKKFYLLLTVLYLLIISCSKEEKDFKKEELSYKSGMVIISYRGEELVVWKNEDGDYLIDGDILLYKNEVKELSSYDDTNKGIQKRSTAGNIPGMDEVHDINVISWPNAKIDYEIGKGFSASQIALIYKAIQHWNDKTDVDFTEAPNSKKVLFKQVKSGCRANMGYPGDNGINTIKLSETCDLQSIIHEIGHVVGLMHEHQRINRDNHITLKRETFDFIQKKYPSYSTIINNLRLENSSLDDPFPFDMNSVMMYGSYPRNDSALRADLVSQNLPLYTTKDGSLVERPTSGLTEKDVNLVNHFYIKKLFLRNVDYNVVNLRIRSKSTIDYSAILLNPGDIITLLYDKSINKFTYNGYVV